MPYLNPVTKVLKSRETRKGGSLALTAAVFCGHLAKGLVVLLPVGCVWHTVEEELRSTGVPTDRVGVWLAYAIAVNLCFALFALLALAHSERQNAKTVSPVPLRVDGGRICSFSRPPTKRRHLF